MRNISKINFRDVQALNGLRVCGYALRSDLERIISGNRIDTMLLRGYLDSKRDIQGREVTTYTAKGKGFMRRLDSFMGRGFYPKQPNAIAHDTALFHQYTFLSPSERMTARSETETRDTYRDIWERSMTDTEQDRPHHSVPDMVYTTTEGETIAIEIITSNYTQEKIEAKEATAAVIGAKLHLIKI